MKYRVLDSFKAQTDRGEMELQPGQVITLPYDKALRLLNEGKITPLEKVVYKVYSELLECHLWVVETDKDMHSLRTQGVTEAIYTKDEIKKLKGLSRDSLKEIHRAKEVFPESSIEEIKFKEEAKKHEGQDYQEMQR